MIARKAHHIATPCPQQIHVLGVLSTFLLGKKTNVYFKGLLSGNACFKTFWELGNCFVREVIAMSLYNNIHHNSMLGQVVALHTFPMTDGITRGAYANLHNYTSLW